MTITRFILTALASSAACAADAPRDLFHEVTLDLKGALWVKGRDGQEGLKDLQLYLGCREGRWDKHLTGWAGLRRDAEGQPVDHATYYNSMDHDGVVKEASEDGQKVRLVLEVSVNDDPWVKGGKGLYTLDLKREGQGLSGSFAGTFKGQPVSGSVAGSIRADLWPSPVDGVEPFRPGEHPRVLFRAKDLPALRQRAQTPEGKAIVARLRALLGNDGEKLPDEFQTATAAYGRSSGRLGVGAYTLAHGMGYGMLYQLSGEGKYAELARQAVEKARAGIRDRDQRYSWHRPGGKLRAGYSYFVIGCAYDLCYDAWTPEYRRQVAAELQEKITSTGRKIAEAPAAEAPRASGASDAPAAKPDKGSEDEMAMKEPVGGDLVFNTLGGQHSPLSNHYGAWNGGAGAALLCVLGDEGVDDAAAQRAHRILLSRAKRCLQVGYGESSWFYEGHHCGRLSMNTGFAFYLSSLRNALGLDLVANCPEAQWLLTKWVYEIVRLEGQLASCQRGMYAETGFGRGGQSSGGDVSQGFSLVPPSHRPAVLWFYNHVICPNPEKDYDAIVWPHRAVYALLNWPIGEAEKRPDEVLPKYIPDRKAGYYIFRSGWTGTEEDVVVGMKDGRGYILGMGLRIKEHPIAVIERPIEILDAEKGQACILRGRHTALVGDMSVLSGAAIALLHISGLEPLPQKAAPGTGRTGGNGLTGLLKDRFGSGGRRVVTPEAGGIPLAPAPVEQNKSAVSRQSVIAQGYKFDITTIQRGPAPVARVEGEGSAMKLVLGKRTISFEGTRIILGEASSP